MLIGSLFATDRIAELWLGQLRSSKPASPTRCVQPSQHVHSKPNQSQLVWFLAPNIALCEQQFKVFKSILPAFETQLLTGNDDVDHWTDQRTWDAVLANVRIVVSTHKVLLDALTHGFVKLSKLALLIFDEGQNPRYYVCIQINHLQRIVRLRTVLPKENNTTLTF